MYLQLFYLTNSTKKGVMCKKLLIPIFILEFQAKKTNMTRKSLYEVLKQCSRKKIDEKFKFLEDHLKTMAKCPENEQRSIKRALKDFKFQFKQKWTAANNKEERFLKKNEQWLNTTITLPTWNIKRPGRPLKNFNELSSPSRRRKTKSLREQIPCDQLTYAAQMSHRAAGHSDASKVIKDILYTPAKALTYRMSVAFAEKNIIKKHSPSEALAIFVEADMTRKQYEIIHAANKNIYPCYSLLQKAKKECYPRPDSMRVTETCCEINLQDLLDHTSTRLCEYLHEVIETLNEEQRKKLELLSKWGCDGSQQQKYKQKFQNSIDSDANIFQSSYVPLRLICHTDNGQKKIIWQNPVTSSTRYCRPIRIRFVQEAKDITNEEIRYVDDQIKNLKETEIPKASGGVLQIKHIIAFTMIDAKVCNAATNTASTMRCYICGQTSKDFNILSKKSIENPDALKFGLSVLHARIRFFESLLHLSYKIPLKKWQARSQEDKKIVAERKQNIQNAFKEEMGLLVDIPKAGFGNTNDGNTSRRFFADPESSSRITGVDINLIKKCSIILQALSSGHRIDTSKFEMFAEETAKQYVELYGWHPMTPTMHKVLRHGTTIIDHAILPIGQLTEEAAEARNKHFRTYRQNYARKFSRELCNRDILNRLLLSSDPFLSCSRKRLQKKSKPFSKETMELLLPEPLDDEEIHSSSEDDDESTENESD